MDMAAIQTALVGWIAAATGIASGSVIVADQGGPRPSKPFATVKVTDIANMGAYDAMSTSMAGGTPDPGEEVVITAGGHRELSVSVQLFTASTQGTASAMALASKLRAQAPISEALFDAAGVTLAQVGAARNLAEVFRTTQEGRAQVDATLYATESVTSLTTYIETVVVNDGEPNEFTAPEA